MTLPIEQRERSLRLCVLVTVSNSNPERPSRCKPLLSPQANGDLQLGV